MRSTLWTDLLAARNRDTGEVATQTLTIGGGVIYLPRIDGDDPSASRIIFSGAEDIVFRDGDVAELAAKFTETDIHADINTLEGLDAYTNLAADSKALIIDLIAAVRGLGLGGQNLQSLRDAIDALAAGAANADPARAIDGVADLIAEAEAIHDVAAGIGTIQADERQDLTIYVSQDEDGSWSPRPSTPAADAEQTLQQAIAAVIGEGSTYYVIAEFKAQTAAW